MTREESLERLDEVMRWIRESRDTNFTRLAEDRQAKRDERRTFNDWWNEGEVSPGNNPYRHESAAYWAWEGWQAAIRARGEE